MSSVALRQARAFGIAAERRPEPGDVWVFWRCPVAPVRVRDLVLVDLADDDSTLVVFASDTGAERRLPLRRWRELYVPLSRLRELG